MKILIVCQHFEPEQFRINDIAYELHKRGHNVSVLTGLPNYPKGKIYKGYRWFQKRNEVINGVNVYRTSIPGRGNSTIKMAINYLFFAIFGKLRAILLKEKFDIIYVYEISPITMVWPAITAKKKSNAPMILHCLDQWPISVTTGGIIESSLIYKFLYKISRSTYEKANLITISSKSFKDYFINELKISANDKKLIYWPSYAENIYENTNHIENDTFDLVFAGNIGPAQSVETIIEAATILKNENNILFHIVGDGLSKKHCEELCKESNLENVIFHGFHKVQEMKKFYDLADAFIITMVNNPVVNSTLPAKIQSYMMARKPIIGAVSGEVKNVINEAKCGLCCESLDSNTLAKNILNAKNSNNLKKWGDNAYNYYKENFDKCTLMDNLEKIMEDVTKSTV